MSIKNHRSILVCGGTGFVGSEIAKGFLQQGKSVRILARKNPTHWISNAKYVFGDVFDDSALDKAMKGCDAVVNAIQFPNAPLENPSKGQTYEHVDAEGTEAVVRAAKRNGLNRILYISGAGTDEGKPEPWFRAKWRAETSIRNSGLVYTIFRPSWIYGPFDRTLNKLVLMTKLSPFVFILGSGYKIQPLFVEDVAELVSTAVDNSKAFNQTYEIGGPQALTMKEILQCVATVLGKKRHYIVIPKSFVATVFSMLEKIPMVPVTREALDFITMDVSIPSSKLERVKNDLCVEPKSLREGLSHYL